MQCTSIKLRARGSFAAFMAETRASPKFKGLIGGPRGKALAAQFATITAAEKTRLYEVSKTLVAKQKLHGHSGFQFYMKANGGIIDEQAAVWRTLTTDSKKNYRSKGMLIPLVKRAASRPGPPRKLTPWAKFLRRNKAAFRGCTGRQALDVTRVLAKKFKKGGSK